MQKNPVDKGSVERFLTSLCPKGYDVLFPLERREMEGNTRYIHFIICETAKRRSFIFFEPLSKYAHQLKNIMGTPFNNHVVSMSHLRFVPNFILKTFCKDVQYVRADDQKPIFYDGPDIVFPLEERDGSLSKGEPIQIGFCSFTSTRGIHYTKL